MPAKNVVRFYTENQYLHIYNRGVENRKIFMDEDDYEMFLYYLFIYLADPEVISNHYPKLRGHLKRNNLSGKLEMIAYCLMPNHFHFLVHQKDIGSATSLIKQVINAYTRYFNTKYHRVGPLMQGKYKAVVVENDNQLLHLSRYIHQNPLKINFVLTALKNYAWSSYAAYLGLKPNIFLKPQVILDYYSQTSPDLTYSSFVEASSETNLDADLTLESE